MGGGAVDDIKKDDLGVIVAHFCNKVFTISTQCDLAPPCLCISY